MDRETLKEALKPWIRQESWHTNHQCDVERFNKALAHAISKLGSNIHDSDLEEVISELSEEYSPKMQEEFREELVGKYVSRADHILTYLSDIK